METVTGDGSDVSTVHEVAPLLATLVRRAPYRKTFRPEVWASSFVML